MDEIVKALLEANLQLTREAMGLARAVLEARGGVHSTVVGAHAPTFEDFTKTDDLTPTERLFFSEEEEDEEYARDLNGTTTDVSLTKAILEAAGEDEIAASLEPDTA